MIKKKGVVFSKLLIFINQKELLFQIIKKILREKEIKMLNKDIIKIYKKMGMKVKMTIFKLLKKMILFKWKL